MAEGRAFSYDVVMRTNQSARKFCREVEFLPSVEEETLVSTAEATAVRFSWPESSPCAVRHGFLPRLASVWLFLSLWVATSSLTAAADAPASPSPRWWLDGVE